jgi:hypothetical protein
MSEGHCDVLRVSFGQEVLEEEVHLLVDRLLLGSDDGHVIAGRRVACRRAGGCRRNWMKELLLFALFLSQSKLLLLLLLQEVRAAAESITRLEVDWSFGDSGNGGSFRFLLLLLLLELFFGRGHHAPFLQGHDLGSW